GRGCGRPEREEVRNRAREARQAAELGADQLGRPAPGLRAYELATKGLRTRKQQPERGGVVRGNPPTKGAVMSISAQHNPLYEEFDLEDSRIARWRFEQFSELGFGDEEAWLLAHSEADLHRSRVLVAAGCSLELALKILS